MKVCGEPGCHELTEESRCDEHRRAKRRAESVGRPSAERWYGERWKRTRRAFIRVNPTCVACGKPATDVDHIDGLGPHGPHGYDWANLQALCRSCHSKKTAKWDGAFGRPRVDR